MIEDLFSSSLPTPLRVRTVILFSGEVVVTDFIELRRRISKILLLWGIPSIVIGIVLLLVFQFTILGGIGLMAIIWGAIDAFIAYYLVEKQKEESPEKISETVSRSIIMDIVFVTVGLIVVISMLQDPYMMGAGIGVMIQGLFLLLLDSYYYNSLKKLHT